MSRRFATYVDEETAERWETQADEMGMSNSEWIQAMVEAGLKKFNRSVQPDQSRDELRQQNNYLRRELQRARNRVESLENQLHASEREAILEYVGDNPGAEYEDIVQHITNTAYGRVTKIVDQMEGDELDIDEQGRMYTK